MALKLIVLIVVMAAVAAGQHHHDEHHHDDAHYKFAYKVHDEHSKDIKDQHESRDGDKVKGAYSLVEPDGSKRVVEYHGDHHSGFHAKVHRETNHHHYAQHHGHDSHHGLESHHSHHH